MSWRLSRRLVLFAALVLNTKHRATAEPSVNAGLPASGKMTQHDKLANATVRIVDVTSGQGFGSGFHFIKPEIIVSNAHVVARLIAGQGAMEAYAETGEKWKLKLLGHSPPEASDFAVMEASGGSFGTRAALKPSTDAASERGGFGFFVRAIRME